MDGYRRRLPVLSDIMDTDGRGVHRVLHNNFKKAGDIKMKKLTYRHTMVTCFIGYITQAISVNLLPLLFIIFQTDFGISFEKLGRLILIFFLMQFFIDLLTIKFADKIGYRITLVAAHIFSAFGLIMIGVLPFIMPSPYTGLVTAVVFYSVGSGAIEVLVSPIIESIPGDAKASDMALLHSFYCWGQLITVIVTTVLLKVIGLGSWFVIPTLWALVPLYNIFRFIRTPLAPHEKIQNPMSVAELLKNKFFILAIIMMVCAGASEIAMAQWSSLFAETALKIPKIYGDILGPGLFALFMGIGRTVFGTKGHKINLYKAIAACSVFCIVCYLLTIFSPAPLISMAGCSLCGLAVCIMWPGVLSMSAEKFPSGGTAMFGLCAMFGDLGCSVGPWITGAAADTAPAEWGLKAGLFTAVVFPLTMLLGALYFKNKLKDRDPGAGAD